MALVQGGSPEKSEEYKLLEQEGIKLWVNKGISFDGDVIRLERYMTSFGPMVLAENALVR
ncbi:MAG TPA: hypothetical protein DCE03_00700 [Synergistaceae bacterium]|nr:hypothetical protein [Synergistales bacterium]HAA47003.1 hypothetical protein [Synergistaceae bacterium]HAG23054.1 hypothetical protein [Synergistaceae bacterium]